MRRLWAKIEAKIESLKSTPEYDKAVTKAKKDLRYDEKVEFIKKQNSITAKMEKLRSSEEELQELYEKEFIGKRYWGNPIPKSSEVLDKEIAKRAVEILAENLPSKQDLESDIVIEAMSPGGTNILDVLTTKYGL